MVKQKTIIVLSYNLYNDTFVVRVPDTQAIDPTVSYYEGNVDAGVLAGIVGDFDEPEEFVGKTFTI